MKLIFKINLYALAAAPHKGDQISKFHNHAQWLNMKDSGESLDNQTWHTNGWLQQNVSKVWFSCSHNCTLANGAFFHSVCQVWLSSGQNFTLWLLWLIRLLRGGGVWKNLVFLDFIGTVQDMWKSCKIFVPCMQSIFFCKSCLLSLILNLCLLDPVGYTFWETCTPKMSSGPPIRVNIPATTGTVLLVRESEIPSSAVQSTPRPQQCGQEGVLNTMASGSCPLIDSNWADQLNIFSMFHSLSSLQGTWGNAAGTVFKKSKQMLLSESNFIINMNYTAGCKKHGVHSSGQVILSVGQVWVCVYSSKGQVNI